MAFSYSPRTGSQREDGVGKEGKPGMGDVVCGSGACSASQFSSHTCSTVLGSLRDTKGPQACVSLSGAHSSAGEVERPGDMTV